MQRFAWLMIFTSFWVLLNPSISNSQDEQDFTMLRVESGGSVHFSINSMRKYREGMTLENWTRLAVYFSHETNSDAEWELLVRAMSEDLIGDYDFDLPLAYLSVKVESFSGTAVQVEYSPIELTTGFQTLISGATQGAFNENKIHISYQLGDDDGKQLKGKPFGYYYVDLDFCLRKSGDTDGCKIDN